MTPILRETTFAAGDRCGRGAAVRHSVLFHLGRVGFGILGALRSFRYYSVGILGARLSPALSKAELFFWCSESLSDSARAFGILGAR